MRFRLASETLQEKTTRTHVCREPEVYCMDKHTAYCTLHGGSIIELEHVYVWLGAQAGTIRQSDGEESKKRKKTRPRDADRVFETIPVNHSNSAFENSHKGGPEGRHWPA